MHLVFFFLFLCCFNIQRQEVDLTSYLPVNYVKDGSVDYTKYLQEGLNENKNVCFPNFPILINENGLDVKNNQILKFQNGSSLIMKPNAKEKYGILNLINVKNVTIHNPYLVGDRNKHLGTKGEWGMGINILSSENIRIINPYISNCWGDGIYVGEIHYDDRVKYKLTDYASKDIKIIGGVIDNNRRNGISVISVKGLLIKNTMIKNTHGTLPMAGVDIEPNNNGQSIEDVRLIGVTTKNNAEVGFKYVPSGFFGHRSRNVSILLENCSDVGSKVGLFIGGARPSSTYKSIKKFDGAITIRNFHSYSNEKAMRIGSIQQYSPTIKFDSFKVFHNGKRSLDKEKVLKSRFNSERVKFKAIEVK